MQQTHSCSRTQTPDLSTSRKSRQHCLKSQQPYKPGILLRGVQVINGQVALNGRHRKAAWLSPGLAAPTGRLPRAAANSCGPQALNGSKPLLISLSLISQTGALRATSPPLTFHPTMTAYPMGTWPLHHRQCRLHLLSQALTCTPMAINRQCKSLRWALMLAMQP